VSSKDERLLTLLINFSLDLSRGEGPEPASRPCVLPFVIAPRAAEPCLEKEASEELRLENDDDPEIAVDPCLIS
jgi:hypothetical protein